MSISDPTEYETIDDKVLDTLASREWFGIRFPHDTYLGQCAAKLEEMGLLVLRYGPFILLCCGPQVWGRLNIVFKPKELNEGWEDGYGPSTGSNLYACLESVMRRDNKRRQLLPERVTKMRADLKEEGNDEGGG